MNKMIITPDKVAYWFFRINGCLTIENFVIHPETRNDGSSQITDADLLAVRFPHREELGLSGESMEDHEVFQSNGKIDLIIAEIKRGPCMLNGPWTNPDRRSMHRVLYAIGGFPKQEINSIAESLYTSGYYSKPKIQVRLFAVGREKSGNLFKAVVQLTWGEILTFLHYRFSKYQKKKAHHPQWDVVGHELYEIATRNRDSQQYLSEISALAGLRNIA
jgi:hypothetical protein